VNRHARVAALIRPRLLSARARTAALVLVLLAGCGDDEPTVDPKPGVCSTELTRITHAADEGAGPAELGDADTDGNGILDRDEWGDLPPTPLDGDFDGTPDYEDADDDGDGLLDVYDPERLERAPTVRRFAEDPTGPVLSWARTDLEEGRLWQIGREGASLTLRGERLGCDSVVAFLGGDAPVDVVPDRADESRLEVTVPDGARGPVAVFRGGIRSGAVPLHVVDSSEPFLHPDEDASALLGEVQRRAVEIGRKSVSDRGRIAPRRGRRALAERPERRVDRPE